MQLKTISLTNIRKHTFLSLDFSQQTTVIVGENGSGKTTIAEALYFLTTGESFRASVIDDVIEFESEFGRIIAVVEHDDEQKELELLLTKGLVQGKRVAKRLYSVNGVRRRKKDFVGQFASVVFRPEDMRLIEGSKSRRRGLLDAILSVTSPEYARSLGQYEKALTRRNKVLLAVREGEQSASSLQYWDMSILKHGVLLQEERRKLLSTFIVLEFPVQFRVQYLPSVISPERQEAYRSKEIAAGRTLVGPHKDDFMVTLQSWRGEQLQVLEGEEFDIARFGSRGQQRLGVLWLKLCELQYLESTLGYTPLLMLDDIFSELDDESRVIISDLLPSYQSVITTVRELEIDLPNSNVVRL
ncbi:MAG: DNA replication/repair protein RecF [Pseudomonadales bacterium]|nr:DNA replication/repair protein RecF [Candidatus Woesebacteria bacterium]MCB9801821.1 DNA replication/repair protein RecF [Pseudomonadales bacterium]